VTRNTHEAEEIAQDAYLKFWERWPTRQRWLSATMRRRSTGGVLTCLQQNLMEACPRPIPLGSSPVLLQGTLLATNQRGMNADMPWSIERTGSALHVTISVPMDGEREPLMDEVQANLAPKPLAIHLPSKIEGATKTDGDMLKVLWDALGSLGIPLLPPNVWAG
jgi:hypothetical protein